MSKKPPQGVKPYRIWREEHPSPSVKEWSARYTAVSEALERRRLAGLAVPLSWYEELGLVYVYQSERRDWEIEDDQT